MAVKPITPAEVAGQKKAMFPDEVLQAFNEIIASNFSNGRSDFTVAEVVKLMVAKGLKSEDIFANHWLDVEPVYEKAGWKVEYDQPGFNESYASNFTFTRKRRS